MASSAATPHQNDAPSATNSPDKNAWLDILIPTYNRCDELRRNILLLNEMLLRELPGRQVRILVSDNASQDDTVAVLSELQETSSIELRCFYQTENTGGEANVVFLLGQRSAEHVMFLGDDDFLPDGYLSEMNRLLEADPALRVIVPGIASLYPDGTIVQERMEAFAVRKYPPGSDTVLSLSYLGHQISGIVFRAEGLLDAYLARESLRNLYPTIFFLGFSCERGPAAYVPSHKVLISQGNKKYWRYDSSGLLSEMFRNYQLLYPSDPWLRLRMSLTLMYRQPTRLGFGMNPLSALRGFFHLLTAPGVDPLVRLTLPVVAPLLYLRRIFRFVLRRLGWLD